MTTWKLDERDGDLVVQTDVTGRAARLGHRLTLTWTRWRAEVVEHDGVPVTARLRVEADSLQVSRGDGGVVPLSPAEKPVVRRTALRTLGAAAHPVIEFSSDDVTESEGGYEIAGELTIRGTARPLAVTVSSAPVAGGATQYDVRTTLRQSTFGVKPVSVMIGALRVADDVTVSWTATRR